MAKPITYCSIEGCENRCVGRGWCSMHYYRWKRTGDPELVVFPKSETGLCTFDGCEGKHLAGGYCVTHYTRFKRHGDPATVNRTGRVARAGHRTMMANGYVSVYNPTHPIATKSGNVLEHRIVLYEKIGSGTHPCHHCGRMVTWMAPIPDRLETDHLDFDRANNHPANVVPSCFGCNSHRHRQMPFPKDCALVPPNVK